MKHPHQKSFSKEPTVKRDPRKLNLFHQKRNQLKTKVSLFSQNGQVQFDFADKRNQKQVVKPTHSLTENSKTEQLGKISPKIWWIHLWNGLVIDREAKHHRLIRHAIWLYIYLLLIANRQTGISYRRISTISAETGFNRRSIQRWLNILREKGYIETHSTGRALQISITKWQPISRQKTGKETTD